MKTLFSSRNIISVLLLSIVLFTTSSYAADSCKLIIVNDHGKAVTFTQGNKYISAKKMLSAGSRIAITLPCSEVSALREDLSNNATIIDSNTTQINMSKIMRDSSCSACSRAIVASCASRMVKTCNTGWNGTPVTVCCDN